MNQMQGVICDFKELWQKELMELGKMMKDNRISYFMGCMKSLVTASIPGITTALSTYLGGYIPPWIVVASLGLVGSIGIGVNSIKYRKERTKHYIKVIFCIYTGQKARTNKCPSRNNSTINQLLNKETFRHGRVWYKY